MQTQENVQTQNATDWRYLDGVRSRRIGAFLIDYGMVFLLIVLSIPIVAILGLATLGVGWLLYAILGPLVALTYVWWTVGGERQATWGMQIMNIKLVRYDNQRIDGITAVVHAVLFWAQSVIFFPLLAAPLFLSDKRTLHDLAMGTLVIRNIDTHA